MRKLILAFLLLIGSCFLLPFSLYAQYSAKRDTVFSYKRLIVPGSLMLSGVVVRSFAHESIDISIKDRVLDLRGSQPAIHLDDYLQYAPIAANIGLKLAGVKSEHDFLDLLTISSGAYLSVAAVSRLMKWTISSPRPNGMDNKSFPSGHTCVAFTGAELMRMEYGWAWGLGAYTVATGVAALRVYNNYHWFSDLLMGAGLGIICAHAGELLLDPIKSVFVGSNRQSTKDANKADFGGTVAFSPSIDPISGAMCASFAYIF